MNWTNLTIAQVDELNSIDANLTANERLDEAFEIIYGVKMRSLPTPEYVDKINDLDFLTSSPKLHPISTQNIKINNREYKLVVNLNNLTAGQYIDIQEFIKLRSATYYQDILSAILVQSGMTYDTEDILQVRNDIKTLDAITGMSTVSFFFVCLGYYIKNTQAFLHQEMKKSKKKKKKIGSPRNGRGCE